MKISNLKMGKGGLFVPGFKAAGISCGIKRGGKKDLALIYSETPATVAGVFTTNAVKAAPVLVDMERVKRGISQAIIVNSGNANACTGRKGLEDAKKMAELTEKALGIKRGLAMVSSTGVIGEPLPMDRIKKGILTLDSQLSTLNSQYGWQDAAEAIMTTDTLPKLVIESGRIGSKEVTILGIAKGAGMICPNLAPAGSKQGMATMLAFLVTDAAIERRALQYALEDVVDRTFNRITVDGDTSTNDMVLMLADGKAGNTGGERHGRAFHGQGVKGTGV
ncbi:MAG: bifunctional ornithine acetyltransferase/N-acetylglutamate synthase, partial [Deltaproteobacteria bacterium]|nr:bifunctional ornithine acetyltransferase/N-acetylglutamate synthase [Deltaproteobacteria bacterium]